MAAAQVLHLSNLVFGAVADASGEEGSKIENPAVTETAASSKPCVRDIESAVRASIGS